MSFIPPRPTEGSDPKLTRGLQAVWDWIWNPLQSLFITDEGSPIRFAKQPDGRYQVICNIPKPGKPYTHLHPFKILPSPPLTDDQANTAEPGSTAADVQWRTFRVRAGAYGTTAVDFTDGANESPDNPGSPVANRDYDVAIDFVVPDATAAYYVWVDASDPAAPGIGHGTVIPGGGTDADWWTGIYFLLAVIDTSTYTAQTRAVWRQYIRDDIPKCGA